MKKIIILVAIVLPLSAQDEGKYSQTMKDIGAAFTKVIKALDAQTSRQDVADGGAKLVALFKEVEAFWTMRGAADAIESSKNALAAAGELADPQGIPAAKAALGKLAAECKTCHAAHREKTESGFKIK